MAYSAKARTQRLKCSPGNAVKTLDVALLITLFALLVFVGFVCACNVKEIQIQGELITGFLAIIGAELASCGGIQIFKIKHNKKEEPPIDI